MYDFLLKPLITDNNNNNNCVYLLFTKKKHIPKYGVFM